MEIIKDEKFKQKIPKEIIRFVENLVILGYDAYIVGGACRDYLIHEFDKNYTKKIKDYDVATNAEPDSVKELAETLEYNTYDTGIEYGTITLTKNNVSFEITTFRSEEYGQLNRKPTEIKFEFDVVEDLKRRDFTMNSIIYDVKKCEFIDHFNGINDMKNKQIKSIVNPSHSYRRDPLRILRAFRFLTYNDFNLADDDVEFIKKNSAILLNISKERIRDELIKIITSNNLEVLNTMCDVGVMSIILPEIDLLTKFQQNNKHHHCYYNSDYTLFNHTLDVMKNVSNNKILRLAALFHDIGKPYSIYVRNIDHWSYFNHNEKSVEIARDILNRLRFSSDDIKTILILIDTHDLPFIYNNKICKKSVKNLMNKLENVDVSLWIEHKRADILAHHDCEGYQKILLDTLDTIKSTIHEITINKEAYNLSDLDINGHDLIELGYIGKEIGIKLNMLLEVVMDNPQSNNKEVLKGILKNEVQR